ncbi:hypothetical protein [Pedobacter roseus]|uniref:Uncharacterized protein n=1 Tax=Pedobacter roseus TaxID=336820 RepID=A0A7G9QK55_9SPHI|nr:hypothetical protein [Pedobacter roseus]QNN43730.1 hypothetical protein H9L23_06470 [Pedobacter roseus]
MKKNNNRIWLTAVLLAGTFTLQAQELPQPNPPAPGPEGPVKGAPVHHMKADRVLGQTVEDLKVVN